MDFHLKETTNFISQLSKLSYKGFINCGIRQRCLLFMIYFICFRGMRVNAYGDVKSFNFNSKYIYI